MWAWPRWPRWPPPCSSPVVGVVVARQLAGVPENAMKMVVGLMLVSFGSFWSGEGLGVHWPGGDLAIPVLVGVYGGATFVLVRALNAQRAHRSESSRRGRDAGVA